MTANQVTVSLTTEMVDPDAPAERIAVVIDVLRATTSILHALSAGCEVIYPVETIEEARAFSHQLRAVANSSVLLAGERSGIQISGFDMGNSPREFTPRTCTGTQLVLTTSNGTRALHRCNTAKRTLIAAFCNLSILRELLVRQQSPIHIVCAGDQGQPALEDTLLAGALVEPFAGDGTKHLHDGARIALACWRQMRHEIESTLSHSAGGVRLRSLGYDDDIRVCAQVDTVPLIASLDAMGIHAER